MCSTTGVRTKPNSLARSSQTWRIFVCLEDEDFAARLSLCGQYNTNEPRRGARWPLSQPNSQINSAIVLYNKTRPVKWKIGPFSVLCNTQYHDQALISGSVNCKTMHANNIHAVGYENQVNDYIVTSFQIFWEELFCTDFCQFWESKPNIDLHPISHIERNFTILVWLLLVWNSSPFEI